MRLSFTLATILLGALGVFAQTADDLSEANYTGEIKSDFRKPTANPNPGQHARTAPPAPAATGDNLCAAGTASLTATASSGGTLNWYNVATGGTAMATGTAFSPVVAATTNYWVEEVVAGSGTGPANLIAPYNSNNGQRGAMFDIIATNTVTITNFDANLYTGTTANYEIYYRAGTHVGFENNAAAWTLLGGVTGLTSLGNNVPTPIPVNFSVTIPAGQTYSFYVTNDFGAGLSYTDGTAVGNFLASDANIRINEGVGKSYPFGLTFNVRNFNGTIHYTAGSGPCSSPRTMVTANVKAPSYATTATTTTSNASCTVNEAGVDWTYYYNTANSNDLLFAIAHDPNNLGNNNFTAEASITVNNNSTTTGYYSQQNIGQGLARFVMGRYWNVNLTSGSIVDPVWVRYYYQPAEKTAINTAAANWQGTHGGTQSPLYFFKTDGVPFNPATSLHFNGVYNSLELLNYADNQTSMNGVNYVEVRDVQSFSGGSLITGVVPSGGATTGPAILLELDLLDFKATQQDATAHLSWMTKNERNMSHFVVERSADGLDFEPLGEQMALGVDGQEVQYHWQDEQPLAGVNYYRLKMVETTGAYQYSEVRALRFDFDEQALLVAPNPFRSQVQIELTAATEELLEVLVVNALGQVVLEQTQAVQVGANQWSLPTAHLGNGCYTLIVQSASFNKRLQIVKQ